MIIIRNLHRPFRTTTMRDEFDLEEYSYSFSKSKTIKNKQE